MVPTVFFGSLAWEGSIVWGITRAVLGPGRVVAGVGIFWWMGLCVSGHVTLYYL